jgi:cytochrome c oxidase subunit 4
MSKEHSSHGNHVLPLETYLAVAGALMVLTAVTVTVSFVHFGAWNLVVAMAIAATKAIMVALFFMHLKYDNKIYLAVFGGSVVFLALFIIFTMFDTMRRSDIYDVVDKPINPNAIIYHTMGGDSTHGSAATDTTVKK